MLTGIEIAGIVLATLPLVITAIQERETGVRALDSLIFSKSKRNKDLEILSDQRLRFRHFCSRLLCEVGIENVADYLDVDQRTQSMWAQRDFKNRFLKRLEGSYDNFDRKMSEVKKRVIRIDEYTSKPSLLLHPGFCLTADRDKLCLLYYEKLSKSQRRNPASGMYRHASRICN